MWVMGLGAVGYGVMVIWDVGYGVVGIWDVGYGVMGCGFMGLWGYGLWGYGLWGTPRSLPVPPSLTGRAGAHPTPGAAAPLPLRPH